MNTNDMDFLKWRMEEASPEDLALLDETGYSIGDYAVTVNADGEPTFTIINTYDSKRFCLAVRHL